MSSANPKYVISTLTLDSVTWTPVVTTFACNGFGIKAAVDIKMRTDSADSGTQDTLPAGSQEVIIEGHFQDSSGYSRFPPGTTVIFLQAVSGTPSVTLRFIR